MTITEAINLILTSVGLEGINDAVDTQGDSEVAQVQYVLNSARHEVLTQHPMLFSTVKTTFTPDANGQIRVPSNVLMWQPTISHLRYRVVERNRGEALWDRENNVTWSSNIEVIQTLDVPIDRIPNVIAYWIVWRAAELFSFKLNGTEQNLTFIRAEKNAARQKALNSEYLITDTMSEFNQVRGSYTY